MASGGTHGAGSLFDAITAHSTDSIMLLDRDGRIRFINRTAPGLSVEQVRGTAVYDYVDSSQHAAMRACFEQVLETGEAGRFENIYRLPDGTPTRWESRVGPVIDEGVVTGFVVIASDVTERTAAALQRDRVFELSKDLLCVAALDGHFLRVNPAFVETLGYSEQELLARPFIELVHPEDRDATLAAFNSARENEVSAFENRYLCKDGSERLLQWTSRPDTQLHQIVAVARDVTEQRRLEAQLHQTQKLDAVGQLAGGIAHDFNNLIQAIVGNVQLALGSEASRAKDECLRDIQGAATRAGALTRQLLTFSHKQPLRISRVDVNELSRELIRLLRRVIPESIEIELRGGEALEPVEVDRSQLEQVLMNLCLNARDAMPKGGRLIVETGSAAASELPVREAAATAPTGAVRISVRDTGEGMAPQVLGHIFEPFFTTKGVGEGTGLGLAVVHGIVERHAGRVGVTSTPGAGTTFDVFLPAALPFGPSSEAPAGQREVGGTELLLVAEDEPLVRRVVVELLRQAGYRVLEAGTGEEAVTLAEAHPEVDLLVFDVVLPRLSGPEAYERIRAARERTQRPALGAIFCSGYSDASRFTHAVPEGAQLVPKPFRADELLRAIRAALDARAARA